MIEVRKELIKIEKEKNWLSRNKIDCSDTKSKAHFVQKGDFDYLDHEL